MTAARPTLYLRPMSELTPEHGTVIIFHTEQIYGTCTPRTIALCEETCSEFRASVIGWCELPELVMPNGAAVEASAAEGGSEEL